MKIRVIFIIGTRPEAIKLLPLVNLLRKKNAFEVIVCVTGQHIEMLDQVCAFFDIIPDYNLRLMSHNQSLGGFASKALEAVEAVIKDSRADTVIVQGDTTTALIGALCGYYNKIRVAHVEAGLRSFNKHSPFPEEINRSLIGRLADFHFAPTNMAKDNLEQEGIKENVWVVGNTVIDALFLSLEIIKHKGEEKYKAPFGHVDFTKRIILVTAHRRESFGVQFENLLYSLRIISQRNCGVQIVYPVHPNPNVLEPAKRILYGLPNVHLINPVPYPSLIWIMSKSFLVLTDSGGIQEEAPALGKPVLVMREVTERIEGISAGTAKLVGTDRDKIVEMTSRLLLDESVYNRMSKAINPYGDGHTSERIACILSKYIV